MIITLRSKKRRHIKKYLKKIELFSKMANEMKELRKSLINILTLPHEDFCRCVDRNSDTLISIRAAKALGHAMEVLKSSDEE